MDSEKKKILSGLVVITYMFCILVGFLNPFPQEINYFLANVIFYLLVGIHLLIFGSMTKDKKTTNLFILFAFFCFFGVGISYVVPSLGMLIKSLGVILGGCFYLYNKGKTWKSR